jgi:hypothetical protein
LCTCQAFVGETRVDKFALGAARGKPQARMTAWIKGWLGQRKPTVAPPPVTRSGISRERGNMSVSGPGQNACANRSARSGQSPTQRFAISRPDT